MEKKSDAAKLVREEDKKLGNKGPASENNQNEAQRHKMAGKVPTDVGSAKDRMKGKDAK